MSDKSVNPKLFSFFRRASESTDDPKVAAEFRKMFEVSKRDYSTSVAANYGRKTSTKPQQQPSYQLDVLRAAMVNLESLVPSRTAVLLEADGGSDYVGPERLQEYDCHGSVKAPRNASLCGYGGND